MEWTPESQSRADAAGIRLFRAWPAAATYWKRAWGTGNAFIGYADDPAEVCLELLAKSEHHAAAKVMTELGVDLDCFVVKPEPCAAPRDA